MFLYEIIKNLFLKDILKSIFNLLSTRFIKTFCYSSITIASLAFTAYFFKLNEDKDSGSQPFKFSKFIERDIIKEMDTTIDKLFNQRSEGQELAYFFMSFIEIEFTKDQCIFRWKYIVGFNEGTKKTFKDITKSKEVYDPTKDHFCHKNDTIEKIKQKSNTKIKAIVNRKHGFFALNEDLLSTQIEWLINGYTNYDVEHISYYIKGYKTGKRFYMFQVASLDNVHNIFKADGIKFFNNSYSNVINKIREVTKPKDPLMYFNK